MPSKKQIAEDNLSDQDERAVPLSKEFRAKEDQLGVLWAKTTRQGGFLLQGTIDTDNGPIKVVGFPFLTRKFRSGLTLCLGRGYDKNGEPIGKVGEE